jgi:hypothetical protein
MSEKMWNFKGLHNCGMILIVLWNDALVAAISIFFAEGMTTLLKP